MPQKMAAFATTPGPGGTGFPENLLQQRFRFYSTDLNTH
ncbi:hypothetical protein B4099_0278 [Heyndrickxia coagulans]|uniref:Uncharacterized protein n=1 Tax=Heyndrickxia coagulans TaxID=1398 RepID=A0A150KEL6_HEYCO|nr:hypothetical protein B4099_0278 [Heyndrickxia coagulans]